MSPRIKNALFLATILGVLVFVSACKHSGREYVGSWENPKNTHNQFDITLDGEHFLVKETQGAWPYRQETLPATLTDGILEIKGEIGVLRLTYVKATDTLLVPSPMDDSNVEFRRRK